MLKVTADVRTNSVVDVNQLLADTFMVGQASDIFVVRLKNLQTKQQGVTLSAITDTGKSQINISSAKNIDGQFVIEFEVELK